jgi:hypothetical protein
MNSNAELTLRSLLGDQFRTIHIIHRLMLLFRRLFTIRFNEENNTRDILSIAAHENYDQA